MYRRSFLQLLAAMPLVRTAGLTVDRTRIVVAGAGIIGTSIAYHLARRGAQVTLVEKGRPGGGATEKSFAWINSTYSKQPWEYFLLNRLGIEAWRHLELQLRGALKMQWGGSIEWYAEPAAARALREGVSRHQAWGYATRLMDEGELRRLEPRVQFGRVETAAYAEQEGHVDPVHALKVLLQQARSWGTRVETTCEVTGLDLRNGSLRAVKTSKGEIEAQVLVIACGVDTPRVAALAGLTVPLKDSPGALVHTTSQPPLLNRVVLAPGANMLQRPSGQVVTGLDFGGSRTTNTSKENGRRMLAEAARFLPDLRHAAIDKVTLGWRPLPKDEFPIVGFATKAPDIYLAVMHSGITLSPLIGRLAAVEILDRVQVELLRPFRLARFA